MQNPPSVQTAGFSSDLSLETEKAIVEHGSFFHFCVEFYVCFGSLSRCTIYRWSRPSGGNHIFCQYFLLLCWINLAIDLKWCPWTTGSNTSPKHQWPTSIFDSRYKVLLLWITFCRQTCWWCVWPNHSTLEAVWQTCLVLFIVLSKGCFRATLPKSLLVGRCHFFFPLGDPKTQPISAILN